MIYVLSSDKYGVCNCHWDGYYTGKTYIYQGEPCAICGNSLDLAKNILLIIGLNRLVKN